MEQVQTNVQTKKEFKLGDFSVSLAITKLSLSLIFLIFISKISLNFTKVVPSSLPPLIFQHGMHPYINFALNFLGFIFLLFLWAKTKRPRTMHPFYTIFLYILIGTLIFQTFMQIMMVNVDFSPLMQISGLGMAIILILLYGVLIPTLFPVEKAVFWLKWISTTTVLASMLCLPLFWPVMFKGGRFIGFYKHIPHMVSAATFAFIFFIKDVFLPKPQWGSVRRVLNAAILLILGLAILITSTKAAFVTMAMTFLTSLVVFHSPSRGLTLFKFVFITILTLGTLLFGGQGAKFMYEVTTGQRSFGMRRAQNGIETRMEEVYRGLQYFQKSPILGRGLLYKFMSGKGIKVTGYNSFKDPHNLFVSAGVIGGWPLMILSIVAYILMIFGVISGIKSDDSNMKIMAIFLLSHLPVFVIYHAHFSLGGMGDRMYYLCFGYLGLANLRKSSQKLNV